MSKLWNRFGGVMVSVLFSSAIDRGFESRSGQTKYFKIGLDQHAELDFYSASSLKHQSEGIHIAPLGHIILIPSQPVFALSP
jgi:hypothetical protein